MTFSMWIASLAWVLLVSGYLNRASRKRHLPLVLSGLALDFALVLYLQITREAVQTALEFSLTALEQMHIAFSSLSLLLYFPVLYFGFLVLRGNDGARQKHKMFAMAALVCRTAGFIFMFSMWK